jgi:hypothetical protein
LQHFLTLLFERAATPGLQRCNPGLQRGCSAATLCNLLQPSTRGCSGVAEGCSGGCRGLQRVAEGPEGCIMQPLLRPCCDPGLHDATLLPRVYGHSRVGRLALHSDFTSSLSRSLPHIHTPHTRQTTLSTSPQSSTPVVPHTQTTRSHTTDRDNRPRRDPPLNQDSV